METDPLNSSLREILDAVSDGVYVTTDDREIVFWSQGAERLTGYGAADVLGKHCFDNILIHTDLLGRNLCVDGCPLWACIKTGERQHVDEVFLKRKDGSRLAVYVKAARLQVDGRVYAVEVFGDLQSVAGSVLTQKINELSDASTIDQLTGLFNRRYIDSILDAQFDMFKRVHQRFGIVMLDVDKFKYINDTFGHLAGDEALRLVACSLRSTMRGMDYLARFGGDEFIIVCQMAETSGMESLGQRAIGLVHNSVLSSQDGKSIYLSISAGAAVAERQDATAQDVLKRADEALYRAKNRGGNEFVLD